MKVGKITQLTEQNATELTENSTPLHIEPNWSLKIIRAENGYIVSRLEQLLDGDHYRYYHTLVSAGETEDDQDELRHLLYEIASYFDPNHKLKIRREDA